MARRFPTTGDYLSRSLTIAAPLTLSFWFRVENQNLTDIVRFGDYVSETLAISLNSTIYGGNSPGTVRFVLYIPSVYNVQFYGPFTISVNAWYHLAFCVASRLEAYAYLNGQLGTLAYNAFGTGNGSYGTTAIFGTTVGSLADVAVWRESLSRQNVNQIYHGDRAPFSRGSLLAHWPLGGRFPNLDCDYAPRQLYPLTATGTPTWVDHPPQIKFPRRVILPAASAEPPATFNPSWASGSNNLIGL